MIKINYNAKQKPPPISKINWSDPLSRGMRFYTNFAEQRGSKSYDLVNGYVGQHTNITRYAKGVSNASSSGIIKYGDHLDSLTGLTISCKFKYVAGGGSFQYIFNKHFNAWNMYVTSTGDWISVAMQTNSNSIDSASWSGDQYALVDGAEYHLMYVWRNHTNIDLYIDGVYTDTNSLSGDTINPNTYDIALFNRGSDSARSFYGDIENATLWDRGLAANEVKLFCQNQNRVIQARQLFFGADSGGEAVDGDVGSTFNTFEIDMSGFQGIFGDISSTIPQIVLAFAGVKEHAADVEIVTQTFDIAMVGVKSHSGDIGSTISNFTVEIEGQQGSAGDIEVVTPMIVLAFSGVNKNEGDVDSTISVFVVDMSGTKEHDGDIGIITQTFVLDVNGLQKQDVDGDIEIVTQTFILDVSGSNGIEGRSGSGQSIAVTIGIKK